MISNPSLAHAFMWDEKGIVFRTQPSQLSDEYVSKEHDRFLETARSWLGETRQMTESLNKKARPFTFYSEATKRKEGVMYLVTAYFTLPDVPKDRAVVGRRVL